MTVFALVDCNNFYASCEKLFRPDIRHKPVVVLSNNDGCVIARSAEAKQLGIKMGVPVFKIRDQIKRYDIQTFSSNYALYADMSSRVMTTLEEMVPQVEVYSIDEAFLDMTGMEFAVPLQTLGEQIRQRIADWVGLPMGVGIGPTKTLAKLANYATKKYPATKGVVDLMDPARQQRLLRIVPVDEVWGVGRRLARRISERGIKTAFDLSQVSPRDIQQEFSVVLERTVRELNGESCIELEEVAPLKKQLVCSRSFGTPVTTKSDMYEALCEHTTRAGQKLRKEQQCARRFSVFIRTSRYKAVGKQYARGATCDLPLPSDDTRSFIRLIQPMLDHIWKDGYQFAKCGVMLSDMHQRGSVQADLFVPDTHDGGHKLMETMDYINDSGIGKVFFAGQGLQKSWAMKRNYLSPAYTTRWQDLPSVH